ILQSDLGRANNLTNTIVDPQSKEPDFKFTAVSISKYIKPIEKIVIIGAGAAAFRFIQNYRDQNTTDSIEVFSHEANPFYNRVLLPEYISEELSWQQLEKIKKDQLDKLKITLHHSSQITSIDRENKTIIDNSKRKYSYDKLILATGSSPFVPPNAQLELPGRFTIRTKTDADRFKAHLNRLQVPTPQKHVVVVGGGLLGLEMAAALKPKGLRVTIIQRSSRLMERQLDKTSSTLLSMDVQDKGIQIYFDNEVSTVFNHDEKQELSITLKSGKAIVAHAIVYAIGTIPNIDLAKKIKLDCGRGVKVNEHLQTSDPTIFAIGEIAQFDNRLFGITAAAEQQADILANYFAGDINSIYKGSVPMNILKFNDLDLCSIGELKVPENDPSYEEIIFSDFKKRYYKKCIVKDDHLIGAILMGDKNEFAQFKEMISNRIELADKRNQLLRSTAKAKQVKGSLVCSCAQVGIGNLQEAMQAG